MKPFMDEHFLLSTPTAQTLYHRYAKPMPIVDYHCHVDPAHIAQNKRFASISELWLGGDHYKWRLMRANGTPEHWVTAGVDNQPYETFQAFAQTLSKAIGNPVYHWTHLELQRYFQEERILNEHSAADIYRHCNGQLNLPALHVRGLIQRYDVRLLCTTDDPIDDLHWHREIQNDDSFAVQVLPAFRPDRAMALEKPDYAGYIQLLAQAAGLPINRFSDLCQALRRRIDFFDDAGCRISDHGLTDVPYAPATPEALDVIFQKGLDNQPLTPHECHQFHTAFLLEMAKHCCRLGWTMQLHFGCLRNVDKKSFCRLGPDTGLDAMSGRTHAERLAPLLSAMNEAACLPKMILYSLNPGDNEVIQTIAGSFTCDAGLPGKLQLGAAWWFNDTKSGMQKQLTDLANTGLLGNFIGMLTDSRSFLSYTRHEYFRRILCDFVGNLVEHGEYPNDPQALAPMIQDICYNNAVRHFGFDLPLIYL